MFRKIKNGFKFFDIFGSRINLKFKDKSVHVSIFGGLLSISFFVLIIFYIV